jgi:hypothetical protein
MRMNMKRFTRLTKAHSKKVENDCTHFGFYNFIRRNAALQNSYSLKPLWVGPRSFG